MSKIPGLVPEKPMPAYSYVPGKFPHPSRDSDGHSFGVATEEVVDFDPERWRDCHAYLRGIDLFNHGFYWEAHESWEAVWHAAGRQGPTADFIKGLIKLAAAYVKAREGRAVGVVRHATRSEELFRTVQSTMAAESCMMGLSLADLRENAQWLATNAEKAVNTSAEPVVRIHGFVMTPRQS